jgi:hypothetical protein
VDDFRISAAGVHTDVGLPLQDHDIPASHRKVSADSQSDDASANNYAIEIVGHAMPPCSGQELPRQIRVVG